MANERRVVAGGAALDEQEGGANMARQIIPVQELAAINRPLVDTVDFRLDTIVARMDESADCGLSVKASEAAASVSSHLVGEVFLHHGLQYVPNDCLMGFMPGLSLVSKAFLEGTQRELHKRCEKCHPALALASQHVTWREWCRFELNTEVSMRSGELWPITAQELYNDIDVLMEVSRGGSTVWSGVTNLHYVGNDFQRGPECKFRVPHWVFDAPLPEAVDVFSADDVYFPGMQTYLYWCGLFDCSLQQKTICKTLYCIHSPSSSALSPPSPLHVHVVFRRRSTGQMVTVLSTNEPNQILGEDYRYPIGSYEANYKSSLPFGEDDRLWAELRFNLFCSSTVDESATSIKFGSRPVESDTSDDDDSSTHTELDFI